MILKKRRLIPNKLVQLGIILKNRQTFITEIEDHFLVYNNLFLSYQDFKHIQEKYSPKKVK